jgi:ABC-type multidrug transport system ATPase subunit
MGEREREERETQIVANGGPAGGGRRGSKVRGSLARPAGAEMTFQDVCVDVADKRILWRVSGNAVPGQMLAIMGPSGAGKTTLLNALAGQTPVASGRVLLDGHRMTKKMKRRVSYVQQEDIFFPNLTLRETLRYSALIRLPSELSIRKKLGKVEEILSTLRLQECATTSEPHPLPTIRTHIFTSDSPPRVLQH